MEATSTREGPWGSERARALHARFPAIDLHADSLMWARWTGYDLHRRHEPILPRAALGGHLDLPRMREGGMGAQFFGLVSIPFGRAKGNLVAVMEQIDELERAIDRAPDALAKVRTRAELEAAEAAGRIAALLGVEGAHALEGDLANVARLADRGVRYLGFCHFSANELCFPAFGQGRSDDRGLTELGREAVRACEDAGVIVDLAHINRKGLLEVCSLSKRPVIVSHTGVLGAFEHWRNVDDASLRAVADTGGCVGVIFVPKYLGGSGLSDVVRHVRHIVDVCGEDAPALGSDWDGFIVPTPDLKDASRLPLLTDALLQGGFSEEAVGKILRTNALRVLEA